MPAQSYGPGLGAVDDLLQAETRAARMPREIARIREIYPCRSVWSALS